MTSDTVLSRLLVDAELIGEHSSIGFRVYKAEFRHIPLLVPLIKEYYDEDPFCKAAGIRVNDDHAWPLAFNGVRYPSSCFGVINEEVVMITLGLVEFCDEKKNPLPAAEVSSAFSANDAFQVLEEVEKYFRMIAFSSEHFEKCVLVDISYIRREFRGRGLGNFSNACFNRLCLRNSLGISRSFAVCTSKASLSSFKRVGYEEIGEIPDDLYVDGNGNHFVTDSDGVSNAAIVMLNFSKITKEMEIYKKYDNVYYV